MWAWVRQCRMRGFLIVRTLLLTVAALAALASPASAADYDPVRNKLVFKPHPVEAPEPSLFTTTSAFTWMGFYLGIQAGYASGEDRSRLLFAGTPVALPVSTRYDIDGAVAGVHTGYNVQLGMFVLGAEGDLELSAIEGSFAANPAGVPIGVAARTNVNWQSSVRARVGVAMDRLLVYGTGGFVYAEIDNAFALSVPAGTFSETAQDTDRFGWTVGGGVEYAFFGNVTTRAEYRYTSFGRYEIPPRVLLTGLSAAQEPNFHTFRLGLSYKY